MASRSRIFILFLLVALCLIQICSSSAGFTDENALDIEARDDDSFELDPLGDDDFELDLRDDEADDDEEEFDLETRATPAQRRRRHRRMERRIRRRRRREHRNHKIKRDGTFPITGVQDGTLSPRLEIRTLASHPDQWNLFLLALRDFQLNDQSNELSYYGIAGVHGVPNIPWDGVGQSANTDGALGFCTHSTQLFPGWHRPYVAVFEQIFLRHVHSVVQKFPSGQQARWRAAAKNMRWPYWDWAETPPHGGHVLPSTVTTPSVTVNGPNGQETITNPLFRYHFHPLDHDAFVADPWDNWQLTYRYPSSSNPTGVSSQESQVVSTFQNNAANIQGTVYQMFTQCNVFGTFSTDQASQSDPACSTSLEAIHGGIHDDMGGNNGHMTVIPWSAFDPSFWLHHCNVDRLFALWQAMHPDQYMTETSTTSGATYAIPSGTAVNGDFPLAPFHSDSSGTTFTTNSIRDWTQFHYTYPEFVGNDGSQSTITAKVNQLYGGGSNGGSSRKLKALRERRDLHKRGQLGKRQISPEVPPEIASLLTPFNRTKDWTINIVTPRYALDSSYSVYMYLDESGASNSTNSTLHGNYSRPTSTSSSSAAQGTTVNIGTDPNTDEPDTDPADCDTSGVPTNPFCYPYAPTLVGSYGIFSSPGMSSMAMPGDLLVSGSVHLTTSLVSLISDGLLNSLDDVDVTPFLVKNLQWRVRKSDETDVDPLSIPGFQVSVVSSNVTPATSIAELPVWGPWYYVNAATAGKPGGKLL